MTVHPIFPTGGKNRIDLAPAFPRNPPMPTRVFSADFSANALREATADDNGIDACPVEVEVNSG